MKLELDDLKRRWEDGHRQLVRLEAAGDRTHVVVQHERKLRRFSGSALDFQLAATKKRVRMSSQEALTEGMAAEISLKDIVQGLAASKKVLTENMVLIQATTNQLMKQQGELLQAIATPMRREHYNDNNQPSNDECYYCHRKGHFKWDCAALKRSQRNNAELASIARRRHGKRRGDTVKIRKVDANEVDSACLKQQLLLPECLREREFSPDCTMTLGIKHWKERRPSSVPDVIGHACMITSNSGSSNVTVAQSRNFLTAK